MHFPPDILLTVEMSECRADKEKIETEVKVGTLLSE